MKYSHMVSIESKNEDIWWFQNGKPTTSPIPKKGYSNCKHFRTKKKIRSLLRYLLNIGVDVVVYDLYRKDSGEWWEYEYEIS